MSRKKHRIRELEKKKDTIEAFDVGKYQQELARRIKKTLKEAFGKLTVAEEVLDISVSTLSSWQRNLAVAPIPFLVVLSRVANKNLTWMIIGEGLENHIERSSDNIFSNRQFSGRKAAASVSNLDSNRVKDGTTDVSYGGKQEERLFEEILMALKEDNELLELVVSLIDSKRKIKGYLNEAE